MTDFSSTFMAAGLAVFLFGGGLWLKVWIENIISDIQWRRYLIANRGKLIEGLDPEGAFLVPPEHVQKLTKPPF